jgi:hypothetical protein
LGKPTRNPTTVESKISDSGSFHLQLLSFTHATNIKARAENHRQQQEYRNQHYETIPQLLKHLFTSGLISWVSLGA